MNHTRNQNPHIASPSNLTREQRAERERNESEGGAEDESTDSDADGTVGKHHSSLRGGTKESTGNPGSDRANDRAEQQREGGGGGYAEEREDTDEASGTSPGKSARKTRVR